MKIKVHNNHSKKSATLYRLATDNHLCPYGLKSRDLLKREGYKIEDHLFETEQEADDFRREHGVETTPQTFIEGERIGGHDKLREYFGKEPQQSDEDETTYQPVIAMFSAALLLAVATTWRVSGSVGWLPALELFVAFAMVILAIQKLKDLYAFSNQFLGYDLLAQKWVRYAYVYPFVELLAGVAMISAVPNLVLTAAPFALFVAGVGAVSVIKAVYIDKRELKCACVGGNSSVPLGLVSLSENLGMVAMSLWMLIKHLG